MNARILFLSLFLLFSISGVEAQFGVNTISGNVFNDARRPVPETFVELLTEFNSVVQRARTNQSGHYTFTRIPYGKYVVRVKPHGTDLQEEEKPVDIYNMSGDPRRQMPMYEQVDFYLITRRAASGLREVTGVVFAQEVPKEASDIYSSIDRSDVSDAAAAKLENAVGIFPKYHDALVQLGSIYIQSQKFAEAEAAFAVVVEVNPQGFNGWYGLGHAQYSLNKPASLVALQKALDINKESSPAWYIMGLAQRKAKNYGEALKALQKAKKHDNNSPDTSWNLALLYYHNLKKPIDAANELEHYLKIDKDAKNKEQVIALIKKLRSANPYDGSK
jgi:tetratricopeptide (TPR) repeat protein